MSYRQINKLPAVPTQRSRILTQDVYYTTPGGPGPELFAKRHTDASGDMGQRLETLLSHGRLFVSEED